MKFLFSLVVLVTIKCMVSQRTPSERLNYFDTDLLKYAAEDHKGNILLSPASIKAVLAMLLEGAVGDTAFEIRSVLRLSPNKNDFREQLNRYFLSLQSNGTTELYNANGIFVSKNTLVNKEYEKMLKYVYLAQVFSTDFTNPIQSAKSINDWVLMNTRGLIKSIVDGDQINPMSDIILANALYFKSDWEYAFQPRLTRSECFYNNGVCKKVAMMELQADLNYAYVDNLRAHAVELPYQGGRYSMIVLIPQERNGHGILVRDLPYMSLPQISQLMTKNEVQLTMPKFNIDYNDDIIGILRSMKIITLFSPQANFTGIFQGRSSQISNMFHKVHLDVNEKGTIAAASTGAVVVPLINSAVQITVDRPFIFLIRDNQLGFVLFEGKIEEPTPFTETNGFNGSPAKKNAHQANYRF